MYPGNNGNAPRRLDQFLRPADVLALTDGNRNVNLINGAGELPMDSNPAFGAKNGKIDVGRHSGWENYLYIDGHAAAAHRDDLAIGQFTLTSEYCRQTP